MLSAQYIGVDMAKDKFNAALNKGVASLEAIFENTPEGFKKFSKWIKKHTETPWICMESTGHYSELLGEYLGAQKIHVSIVNAKQVKHFAKARLLRNKNDIVDARLLVDYGQMMKPMLFQARSDELKEVRALYQLLELLKKQLVQLKLQHSSARSETAKKLLEKSCTERAKEIELIEKKLKEFVQQDEALREKCELITSIPGVGDLTAYGLLSGLPDLEQFTDAKQFAAFLGLSPEQKESGRYQGKTKLSKIGNSKMRKTLYMSALSAKRCNPRLENFATRLKKKGKAPKVIICAVMRKLAQMIFSILKKKQPFRVDPLPVCVVS